MLCSGVAVTMIFVVGLSVLIRRGWGAAAFHTAPLALLYLGWWFAFGRDEYSNAQGSPGDVLRFVWTGFKAAFGEMGQLPGVGLALGLILVSGLVLAWRALAWNELRQRAAAPAALLVGAVVFLAIAGLGRVSFFGPEFARTSRYLHVVAALCLPAIAVAADAFLRRWRAVGVVTAALLVLGIPGNVDLIVNYETEWACCLGPKKLILALPQDPLAHTVPRQLRPIPELSNQVTVGWLLSGVRSGRIPTPDHVDPLTSAQANLRLSLFQSQRATEHGHCTALIDVVTRTLDKGEAIRFDGGLLQVSAAQDPRAGVAYNPKDGRTLTATDRRGSEARRPLLPPRDYPEEQQRPTA
jgi:hypothetical protein